MNVTPLIPIGIALALGATGAAAQFVKGNDAVKVLPDGSRKVEVPPAAGALLAKPCPAADAGCSGGGWKMVETPQGLMECTEIYARPTTCRTSTYGAEKRARVWVVKTGSEWKHCSYPDLGKGCVGIRSLPSPVVQ
ncbi:MAG: hypothetical protein KIT60_13870 [Burkholderiaceae bacterium]|nr:hypothetical protein [Burkholderiaceae bacterium]